MRCLADALQQIGGVCRRPAVLAYSMALSSSDRQDHGRPGTETAHRHKRGPRAVYRNQGKQTMAATHLMGSAFGPTRPAREWCPHPPRVDALGIRV
jgi:hypothetical protein